MNFVLGDKINKIFRSHNFFISLNKNNMVLLIYILL